MDRAQEATQGVIVTHLALGPVAEFPTIRPQSLICDLDHPPTLIPPDAQCLDPFSASTYARSFWASLTLFPPQGLDVGWALCLEFLFVTGVMAFMACPWQTMGAGICLVCLEYLAQCPV